MRRTVTVIVLLVVAVLTAAVAYNSFSSPGFRPGDIELAKYPVFPGKQSMDSAEISWLGLKKVKLDAPLQAFVHYRYGIEQRSDKESHWHWRQLMAGTVVTMDANGRPWYAADTSVRLYVPASGGFSWWVWLSWWNPITWPWMVLLGLFFLMCLFAWLTRPIRRGRRENESWQPIQKSQEPPKPAAVSPHAVPPMPAKSATDDCCEELNGRLGTVERDIAEIKASVAGINERLAVRPAEAQSPATRRAKLDTVDEAVAVCLAAPNAAKGLTALFKRWDASKVSDAEFVDGVNVLRGSI